MNDRKTQISLNALSERIDADAVPIDSAREGSSIVYFCSAEEVSEGFAIALRAMGFTEILPSDIVPQSDTTSNPENS